MYPFLKKLFAHRGYQGPEFQKALATILPKLKHNSHTFAEYPEFRARLVADSFLGAPHW